MNWFDNLEKWKQGGIIGGAVGLFIALRLSILLPTALDTPVDDWVMWAYLFHTWPVYGYVFGIHDIENFSCVILVPALLFSLTTLYAVLGAVWGLIRQIKTVERRKLFTALYIAFLSTGFVINAFASLMTMLY